jgi:hypothetical protein
MAESKEAPPTPAVQQPPHPLDDIIGAFADEPLWDELMEEVRKNRERDAKLPASTSLLASQKSTKQPVIVK